MRVKMEIYVKEREVYGNTLYYPFCEKAKAFARLTGKKTLTYYAMEEIKELGYEIKNHTDLNVLRLIDEK